MDLNGFASALEKAAQDVQGRGKDRAAEAAGHAFLAQLQRNTPVLTGTLRRGERVNSAGGGVAVIGTHTPLYASFRETGGTIRIVRAKVLTDGRRFFGKQVTQAGSHYMARTVAWARGGGLKGPVKKAIDAVLRDAGL